MAITFNNTTYPPGFQGIDDGGASAAFSIDRASTYTTRLNGSVNQVGDTVQMTYGADAPAGYANTSVTLTATQYDNANQILFTAPSNTTLPNGNVPPGQSTDESSYRYVFRTRRFTERALQPDRPGPASRRILTVGPPATTLQQLPASRPAR